MKIFLVIASLEQFLVQNLILLRGPVQLFLKSRFLKSAKIHRPEEKSYNSTCGSTKPFEIYLVTLLPFLYMIYKESF